jgi:formylglycine-generating enzyme required for sulfatase activity/TolB-like protein
MRKIVASMLRRLITISFLQLSILFAQPQIAVVDFEALGVSSNDARALTNRLIIELHRTNKFKILERKDLDKIIEEQKFQLSGCSSDQCLVKLGQIANVHQIVGGSISKVGEVYSISARLISVESGEVIQSALFDQEGEIGDLMKSGMANIAAQLASTDMLVLPDIINKTGISLGIEMVKIPGGTFLRGDGAEISVEPLKTHSVEVFGFYMSSHEITYAQYITFLNDINIVENDHYNGHRMFPFSERGCAINKQEEYIFTGSSYANSEDCPMLNATWFGAVEFCNWLSITEGLLPVYSFGDDGQVIWDWSKNGYRLPTEAEWEYAARSAGRDDRIWSGTNNEENLSNYAWYHDTDSTQTHIVKSKLPNDIGLYDMSGNSWEWCWDWWVENFSADNNRVNPKGPASSEANYKAIRGGGWMNGTDYIKCTSRLPHSQEWVMGSGIRIVRSN